MEISGRQYFLLFSLSFFLVGFLTPIMRKVAISKNYIDNPNSPHKTHTKSVPYMGGIAIIIGIVSLTYSISIFSPFTRSTFLLATSVLAPATVLGVIGFIDDIYNLPPWPRFIAQSIAAIFTAILLIYTDNFGNPTGSRLFDISITILWIVGVCNSINFFDNLDGGAAGTIAVISAGLGILALDSEQFLIAGMSFVTLGSMLGFLIWNRSPARIYMGDAGALFLGILISVLTIRFKPQTQSQIASLLIPVLLLAVPIMDTSVAVISRIKRNLSPFQGGRDHLSHRLVRAGLHRKTAAISLWALSGFFVSTAVTITFVPKFENYFLIFSALIWVCIFIYFFSRKDSD